MSSMDNYFNGPLGKYIRAFLKLGMAGALIGLISAMPKPGDITMGNSTIPVGTMFTLIVGFFPILLLISAMRDLEIKL